MSDIGKVIEINIEDELKRSYLGYAVSNIIARGLPDVRDGLKPAQRRILVAMNDLHLSPGSQHRKSAKIAGDTSGNYHPHGEAVIYPTMVRMAQDFNSRYPPIDGQGNMGSIDGDPPAAMRYTEMRMSPYAMEMLEDLDKDTVDWRANYDQTRDEPIVLPGKFPNLLANGSTGIAVGMATNIPPHNVSELIDGIIHLIDNPSATAADLMQFIKGPDFPTAGMVLGTKGIKSMYETGRGPIIMQAQLAIEQIENGKSAIVVTELPFQVNKARLIEHIADLVRAKKVEGITGLDDYSDRTGMRVVIELRRDTYPKKILNYLLKHTALRTSFGAIMLALDDGQPKIMTLPRILQCFIEHRVVIVTRRTLYELRRAKDRAHILEGLRIAIDFMDEIIQLIRASRNPDAARSEMMQRFGLSQIQADAILNMQLRQLTALERQKTEDEYKELIRRIAGYEDLLSDPLKILAVIKQELKTLKDKLGDGRRTRIVPVEAEEIGEEDMIPDEETIVTVSRDGYIKRVPIDTYRSQRRPGKGIIAMSTKEEDVVEHLFVATTHHYILFFTDKGRVYKLKAYEIPQTTRQAMGTAIINLINKEQDEMITAIVPLKDMLAADRFLVMATEKGEIKRCKLENFHNLRSNGLRAFDLEDDDKLKWVHLSMGSDEVIMVTRGGLSARFHESKVPSRGRPAGGVRGMRLRPGDVIVGMGLVRPGSELLVATELGHGKRTTLDDYRSKGRGIQGVRTMNISPKTGLIVDTKVVSEDDRIIIVTEQGIMLRLKVGDIRSCGRSTQGVRLINLVAGDRIASVERIPKTDGDEDEPSPDGKG
ncbi:MAG: DNA gyrase subunit A [Armatimonadota bacterium]|nr:DNA gyrase subunit A [Armatimonadota bacterium]